VLCGWSQKPLVSDAGEMASMAAVFPDGHTWLPERSSCRILPKVPRCAPITPMRAPRIVSSYLLRTIGIYQHRHLKNVGEISANPEFRS
jgi:hypothetical protein